ncbi:MAG TPA: phosphoribosylformylglycinamidine synthase subunit PurL [Solirubrobacterales bacterium]|jgi:phosphoribosylformylglycinamidine synthase|nr:phosphoribosylformylglycinamidine synthase subunit PurL [Solirubrobacterales bacterium]
MTVGTAKHRELGLTDSEFELIVEKMGREPNVVELAMFSLLWSEHCAYKHSRKLLRQLPTEGERVVMGPGENAGAVDVGNGYAVAFKVESHNHPSAVEPFQGAATGVGGILRDVFAIGARPIAILDSLRFGELDSIRSRHLLDGAVRGIGHYGNSIGVPNVGGEIYFEEPYEHNCLVNAMCLGLAKTKDMVRAAAAGIGNTVVLMGASTGRDGIGGASVLASAELGDGDEAKRPTVQIGDPFEESKVLECCLELLEKGLLVSLQDLGAAGLTSSAGEMAAAGGVGIDIDVARVPLREADMEPFEIMVSESQERMLAVVEPARVPEVLAVCEKWQTGSAEIGVVTDSGQVRILRGGEVVGQMPVEALVDGCPLYDLEPAEPAGWIYGNRATLAAGTSAENELLALLAAPSVASKRWAFEQYDSVVGSRTVRRPESADAAVLQLPESGNAIAVSIDGNGRRVACDPYAGTIEAVLECAQNLACVGAEPLGLTNCLNFGNPEKPATAWQLDQSVSALAEACRALGVPVVGGNVSLYNEGPEGPIYPTPVVGMVGELPDPAQVAGSAFVAAGDAIALIGPFAPTLAGSELAKQRGELDKGLPQPDIIAVAAACTIVRDAVRAGGLASAHDVSDGGLACALAESSIGAGIGCRVDLQPLRDRGCLPEQALFGEGSGGFLVSGERGVLEALGGVFLGEVGGTAIEIAAGDRSIVVGLGTAESAWCSLPAQAEHGGT